MESIFVLLLWQLNTETCHSRKSGNLFKKTLDSPVSSTGQAQSSTEWQCRKFVYFLAGAIITNLRRSRGYGVAHNTRTLNCQPNLYLWLTYSPPSAKGRKHPPLNPLPSREGEWKQNQWVPSPPVGEGQGEIKSMTLQQSPLLRRK